MAKNPPDVQDKATAPSRGEVTEEVVLRDESDEIIDNLKSQLEGLQTQLDAYRSAEGEAGGQSGTGSGGGGGYNEQLTAAWNAGLAPHLASRLREPAEELTSRLDRLIEQASDPELRTELERCRDLAYFFYETFQKISNNHRLLTESLTAPPVEVDLAEFCRLLEHTLPGSGTPLPVEKLADVPRRAIFGSRGGVSVVKALVELAGILFGKELRIQVGVAPDVEAGAEAGAEAVAKPSAACFLQIRIFNEKAGEEVGEKEEVSTFAMRRGITASTVVDLLYVEKIVELQDGRFSFHRRQGKVYGFEVELPYRLIEDGG